MKVGLQEVVVVIGPSGSGKSTLIRCINRMNDLIPGARLEGKMILDGECDDMAENDLYMKGSMDTVKEGATV